MKRLLLKSLLIGFILPVYSQIPSASLAAHWNFNGNVNDISGNGNNGTVLNATLTCDRCGNPNSAYGFNGVNAKIVVNNSSWIDMNNSTDFSICFWIKTYANPNMNSLPISKHLVGSWNGYTFNANNLQDPGYCTSPGQLSFYTASGAFQDACSDNPVCTGSLQPGQLEDACNTGWSFITGVYEAATATSSLFIDGVLQSDIGGISGNLSNSHDLVFGAHGSNNYFYKGALDDIRIYKKKLTQNEILALYDENCSVSTTGLTSFDSQNEITIFPNPILTKLRIRSQQMIQALNIYDLAGKELMIFEDLQKNEMEISLDHLRPGIYLLQVRTATGIKIIKVVKE